MENQMLTRTQLKERGWTDSVIRKFLGEPDELKVNPHYRNGPRMQLYKLSRIEDLEKTTDVSNALQAAAQRSRSRKEAAQVQSAKLKKYINSLSVTVPKMNTPALYRYACLHYNNLWTSRGKADKSASPEYSDDDFLNRIAVNFLRHELTCYDEELQRMFGKLGSVDGRDILKQRILNCIAETYPFLKYECENQKSPTIYQQDKYGNSTIEKYHNIRLPE